MTFIIENHGSKRLLTAPNRQHAEAHVQIAWQGWSIMPGSEDLSDSMRVWLCNGGDRAADFCLVSERSPDPHACMTMAGRGRLSDDGREVGSTCDSIGSTPGNRLDVGNVR
jgi:hypothetical protein